MSKTKNAHTLRHRLEYGAVRTMFAALGLLPFRQRSALMAWVMARVIAPVAGYRKRVERNLALIWPRMDAASRDALALEVTRQTGRTFCELFSPGVLAEMAKSAEFSGPGLDALKEAHAAKRPTIVISGHFGNYDIMRIWLKENGFNIGALYRRMDNPYFHEFYLGKISATDTPLFERGRPGLSAMVKHLKRGGILGALVDVRSGEGIPLPFLGHDALTATSMAELALRYDALVIPFYCIRQPDGVSYTCEVEAPIPHTDPETMTLALNQSLGAQVEKHPEQWFWIHNRWKGVPRRTAQTGEAK